MNKPMRKNLSMKMINNSIIDLPTPNNLSNWWNMGSILGLSMMLQVITGIMLSMHYTANIMMAFESMIHIMRDVNYGWMLKMWHSNGASMIFICMYMHMARGVYYSSYLKKKTWTMGMMMYIMTMATAFMGYVLPWGQMSFWGATVITNLMSAIPHMGPMMVMWIWGGFSVDNPTLSRFFSMHFMMPFIIMMMIILHLFFLHMKGSTNPIGMNSLVDKIPFHPYYTIKDILGFSITLSILTLVNLSEPHALMDPENFMPANSMITPIHIQPEWYFLFAYTILRSVPNKLGGVIALMMSIMIMMLPMITMKMKFKGMQFYPVSQVTYWMFINNMILLTWIGMKPVEDPFSMIGKTLTISYFTYFMMEPMLMKTWQKMIN
nr:cytochrome b [Darthula hardwickii]